ncbi:MAG: sulfite exporter TauE/SafE family protein [Succinivibrio sp.]
MIEEIINQLILFSVTFIANLFASVSGGGAGFIQFPLLILLGLPFATALGTHKVAVVFLGIGAMSKKGFNRSFAFDRSVSLIMLLAGCPAVVAGSVIIISVPSAIAQIILGFITISSGIYTFFKKGFGSADIEQRSLTRTLLGTLCIILIGMFSGSLSSGAGLFATLTLVGVFGLEMKKAIMHTMIFVATIWNGVGAITVGALTSIHWQWIPAMIVAAFAGAFLGTSLLVKMPVSKVKMIFSLVSVLSGVILIIEGSCK